MIIHNIVKSWGDFVYLLFRLIVGLLIFWHGAQKFGIWGDLTVPGFAGFMSIPVWLAYIVAAVELIGGLAIASGIFTRLAAVFAAMVMIVALAMVHFPKGINPLANGGEAAHLNLAAFLVLIVWGAGKLSLEYLLSKKEVF